MQKIDRVALPQTTVTALKALSARVARAKDKKATATKLWSTLNPSIKKSITDALATMATGTQRCMYCEDNQGTDIEHFRPKSTYPDYAFSWSNYLWACSHCNSNFKRTRFPLDEAFNPLLIDPTTDDPSSFLFFSPITGLLTAREIRGTTTIEVCGLNRDVCASGRRDAWIGVEQLILAYAREAKTGNTDKANAILGVMRRYPFQSVRIHLVRVAISSSTPELIVSRKVIDAIKEFPELAE